MIRDWPLVGRAEELALITASGRPDPDRACGIVLSGAAGVGKTRIAREALAATAPRAARRRWIAATASARDIPLGAFADVVSDFGPDPLRRVREAIDGLVGDGCDGQVIVGVDDAHLLDDLSAFTVHQLVLRRLATVVLTVRTGEPAPDAITSIWKDQHLTRLELQPLSLEEIVALAELVLDGPVDSYSAQRLWQYTLGNALYLRHLLENEVNAGRMQQRSGVWVWHGQPTLSPTLTELLSARLVDVATDVRDVLDALGMAEPLDSDVLAAVVGADALAEAETLGLVAVDHGSRRASVRLAHPLLGEANRTNTFRLQRLRGRLADELSRTTSDPRDLVRRAVLTTQSDLAPDPALLVAAASTALQLSDLKLAESLAERAAVAGGGPEARIIQAMSVTWQERGTDAAAILAALAAETTGPIRAQIGILRALLFAASLGDAASAERELDLAIPGDEDAAKGTAMSLRALIALIRGRSGQAVESAAEAMAGFTGNSLATMVSVWTVVAGLGDLGRAGEIAPVANGGYRLAESAAEVSHLRLPLAALHGVAYRLSGMLTDADALFARIRSDTIDIPFQQEWHGFFTGLAAAGRGDLGAAQRSLREVLAHLESSDGARMTKGFARSWLATSFGMAGNAADARREFDAIDWWTADPDACEWDAEVCLAEAWVCAAEGATSQAISVARTAAGKESERGRCAWEVALLQAATQFGDCTTAARLAELAGRVQGPRAPAAAAHAAALASGSGNALLDSSRQYEGFGDRIAATDAAAQAVIAYQDAGLRGKALTASAVVQRLAAECGGAQTPAVRAVSSPQPFTVRQREIISLAAQGLSNKEIADRLTMSIRSVEGHLFRASQRVGANSRDQLIAIMAGASTVPT
ncbi:LuxR family transcriptional regulator [Mycolicibacterium moriokaense]|nr:LuxR family transcriptional regulator [Mycolicibacterium moriokaense]